MPENENVSESGKTEAKKPMVKQENLNSSEKKTPLVTLIKEPAVVVKEQKDTGEKGNVASETSVTKNESVQNKSLVKIDVKKDDISSEEQEITGENSGVLFNSYESDFKKNKRKILDQIRAIRRLPKTRLSLIIGLILLTGIIYGVTVYMDPKSHTFENYKVSVLNIYKKIAGGGSEKGNNGKTIAVNTNQNLNGNDNENATSFSGAENVNTTQTGELNLSGTVAENTGTGIDTIAKINKDIENTIVSSSGKIDLKTLEKKQEEYIKEKWLSISPETTTLPNGEKVYIYKGNTFSKEGLQAQLKKEVNEIIDKKVKEYLRQIYIRNEELRKKQIELLVGTGTLITQSGAQMGTGEILTNSGSDIPSK